MLREWPQPGAISVAHRSVLVLKEVLEFAANIPFSSWGCIVRNTAPVVRLRWTDRDLVSLAAD